MNRTLTLNDSDKEFLPKLLEDKPTLNSVVNKSFLDVIDLIPNNYIDLLFLDPPYNIDKDFNGNKFKKLTTQQYTDWCESWFIKILPKLKKTSSIYFCGDWRSSTSIQTVLEKYCIIQNRITFEREKGRGAKSNWKNASEDIWFATMSNDYTFNVDDVKIKRKVLAPYKDNGEAKDWIDSDDGKSRLTYPSNVWTDITIPFWSMPENTEHPTQKPEKLLAKIILASTDKGNVVLDPFLGSGTTAVTAKKLDRNYIGIEANHEYSLIALKRLKLADSDKRIQGFEDGVFLDRNFNNK